MLANQIALVLEAVDEALAFDAFDRHKKVATPEIVIRGAFANARTRTAGAQYRRGATSRRCWRLLSDERRLRRGGDNGVSGGGCRQDDETACKAHHHGAENESQRLVLLSDANRARATPVHGS